MILQNVIPTYMAVVLSSRMVSMKIRFSNGGYNKLLIYYTP